MPDQVIMIVGQSNALGFLNTGPAPYTPTARVQIWTDLNHDGVADVGDNFNYMNPGVNTGIKSNPADWGPEVQIANDWLAHNPTGTLWIGKVSDGGIGLAKDVTQADWSPESRGELYDKGTAMATVMKADLGVTKIDAVMVMQGETDATDPAKAAAYQANLHDLTAHMRTDWSTEDVVVGRIGLAGAFSDEVRVAQWAEDQADANLASFKTIGFGMEPDGIHYDAGGQISLGQGFFDGWMTL